MTNFVTRVLSIGTEQNDEVVQARPHPPSVQSSLDRPTCLHPLNRRQLIQKWRFSESWSLTRAMKGVIGHTNEFLKNRLPKVFLGRNRLIYLKIYRRLPIYAHARVSGHGGPTVGPKLTGEPKFVFYCVCSYAVEITCSLQAIAIRRADSRARCGNESGRGAGSVADERANDQGLAALKSV